VWTRGKVKKIGSGYTERVQRKQKELELSVRCPDSMHSLLFLSLEIMNI
jgi:hypothetical protein